MAPKITKATAHLWPVLVLLALGAVGIVVYIIDEIITGRSFRIDETLLLALRHPGHPDVPIGPAWLEQSAIDISALGGFTLQWLLGAAAAAFLVLIHRRREAAWLLASVVGASLLNVALKAVLHRPRPELVPHLTPVSNASFPSGHAMISAAIYFTIAAMLAEAHPQRAAKTFLMSLAAVLILLIGCSRIYLGVHWPSDVLAGWCLGAVWALAVFAANRGLQRRLTRDQA